MKKLLLIALTSLSASLAYSQDYYSPTDKDKEPLARFPLDKSFSSKNQVLEYSLPRELTGNTDNHVIMNEKSNVDGIRIYSTPEGSAITATAICMGTEANPGCVVRHKGLNVDATKADQRLGEVYQDPTLLANSKQIAKDFDSINEPIGFVGAIKIRKDGAWTEPTDVWSGYFVDENSYEITRTVIDFGKRTFVAQDAKGNAIYCGSLLSPLWIPNHVAGKFKTATGKSGWFDFGFSQDISQYNGTFAYEGETKQRTGRWLGTRGGTMPAATNSCSPAS